MIITALTPNIDSFLFVEIEDEYRKVKRYQIVLFAAMNVACGDDSKVGIIMLKDGVLALAAGKFEIVRVEGN